MRTLGATAPLLILGFLAGCEHGDTSVPALTPAAGSAPAAETAAEDVTRAQCDRAERCGQVGVGAQFFDRPRCLNTLWEGSVAQFSPCRTGMRDSAVEQCLAEINQHGCDDAMGGFGQYRACKVEDLCL